MNEKSLIRVSLLAGALALAGMNGFAAPAKDVTAKMENLGIPLAQRFQDKAYGGSGAYARNVWALKAFDGRLYIGAGNSSNGGPASNAGPVPIFSFDPKTKKFAQEWNAPDEQLDIFHEFSDGCLYIPGHDPKEDWKLGNFYRRAKGKDAKWEKVRTLPDGVHCYDMEEFDGKLLACGYGTYESSDRGKTFTNKRGPRYYSFFRFPKSVYAIADAQGEGEGSFTDKKGKTIKYKRPAHVSLAKKVAGKDFEFVPGAKPDDVFPETPEFAKEALKAIRPSAIKDKLVYIGGIVHNDHQIQPLGAYVAVDGPKCFKAERIKLPAGAQPWYTMAVGSKVYLLWSTPDGKKAKFVNHVSATSDGKSFTELFSFEAPTFARSMEYLDGFVYFGLGTEVKEHGHFEGNSLKLKFSADEVDKASGTILRYRMALK